VVGCSVSLDTSTPKSDPRPAAGADPATRRRAHEPGAGRRRQRSTMEEARFTIKLSGSLVQCSWFARAAVSADIYGLSYALRRLHPVRSRHRRKELDTIHVEAVTTRHLSFATYHSMRMCTDATALSRRGEAVQLGGACPVVWGRSPRACESCVVWDGSRVPSVCA
jgi:hypothetical protein